MRMLMRLATDRASIFSQRQLHHSHMRDDIAQGERRKKEKKPSRFSIANYYSVPLGSAYFVNLHNRVTLRIASLIDQT
jgi:hypothetical protein